jgi:hypothetical protein
MKGCAERGAKRIRVHILADGRDVAPGSAGKYVEALEADLLNLRKMDCDAFIASGGGRMAVTMDRYEVFFPCKYMFLSCPSYWTRDIVSLNICGSSVYCLVHYSRFYNFCPHFLYALFSKLVCYSSFLQVVSCLLE